MTDYETIIVGGGAMGSSTAWALAKRGRRVLLLEQYELGHTLGASHGEYRNFNVMYHEPRFVQMLKTSKKLWRELEAEAGESLLELIGMVNHGPNPVSDDILEAITAAGFRAEFLPVDEAGSRWAGIRFDQRVLFSPDSGRIKADHSVAALKRAAAARSSDVRHNSEVIGLTVVDDDQVEVTVRGDDGVYTTSANTVVVTAGAWTSKLLSKQMALPTLKVTQVQPVHFAEAGFGAVWPSFTHSKGDDPDRNAYWYRDIYGMLTPGVGIKAGWHGGGLPIDPDRRTSEFSETELRALQRYAREWLPGVDPESFNIISCTYTSTETEDFVLDRVGPIVVGAGFSGQGFKFTPAVGEVLADLVTGVGVAEPEFRIAHRT